MKIGLRNHGEKKGDSTVCCPLILLFISLLGRSATRGPTRSTATATATTAAAASASATTASTTSRS